MGAGDGGREYGADGCARGFVSVRMSVMGAVVADEIYRKRLFGDAF